MRVGNNQCSKTFQNINTNISLLHFCQLYLKKKRQYFFRITPIPAVVKHTIAPTTKAIILLFEI